MMKKTLKRSGMTALAGTVIFHAAVVIALLTIFLRYNPAEQATREWPPVDSSEILFGGEYVMLGDDPASDAPSAEPAPAEPVETTPEPAKAEAATPAMSTDRPSPAKVVNKPAKTDPDARAAEQARERAEAEARRQQQQREATSRAAGSRVAGAFNGKGGAGSPNGNSSKGVTAGQPGTDLKGRTLAHWTRPSSTEAGIITVNVVVNKQGAVTSASYNPGRSKGAAAANTAARASCLAAARQCRFSVALDGPATQRGTISFHFK